MQTSAICQNTIFLNSLATLKFMGVFPLSAHTLDLTRWVIPGARYACRSRFFLPFSEREFFLAEICRAFSGSGAPGWEPNPQVLGGFARLGHSFLYSPLPYCPKGCSEAQPSCSVAGSQKEWRRAPTGWSVLAAATGSAYKLLPGGTYVRSPSGQTGIQIKV